MPAFICRKLSYDACANLHDTARDKLRGKPISKTANYYIRYDTHTNPTTGQSERAYSLRMYSTDILVFWQDGTIYVDEYNSITTNTVLDELGPLHIFTQSTHRATCKHRFWVSAGRGANYPMCGGVVINPDGVIHGRKDTFRRVKEEAKKERAAMTKQFRKHAVPRILLGEFGDAFCMREQFNTGWKARVPRMDNTKRQLFCALSENKSHEEIFALVQDMSALTRKFGRHEMHYPTPELAAFAAINSLIRSVMQDSYNNPWYEDYVVEFEPVRVR